MLIAELPDGNYWRRKTPGLCLVEALPAEVVALGISICDTTRDGSRIVGHSDAVPAAWWPAKALAVATACTRNGVH